MDKIIKDELNFVQVTGSLDSFDFSHEYRGEKFYKGVIKSVRKSKEIDSIPFITSERNIVEKIEVGNNIKIKGSLRSYNIFNEDINKTQLQILIYVSWDIELIKDEKVEDTNEVYIMGYICKKPVLRNTPKNRVISDVMVAVNRKTFKCDYIPCIAWEKTAETLSKLKISDKVKIKGRVQSREYEKEINPGEKKTFKVIELSIFTINLLENKE
ncbi:MAG: single-stranded DNA-binding protein [Clostridia bacterium]|nr:single-stranded DNA-binding protein [Clostridia bacterium]